MALRCILLRIHRLKLHAVLGVLASASGATSVEILFDMVPAETTDLATSGKNPPILAPRRAAYLIAADARLEVQVGNVHLLQAKWTLCLLLHNAQSIVSNEEVEDRESVG
jgi:hypothetical protein